MPRLRLIAVVGLVSLSCGGQTGPAIAPSAPTYGRAVAAASCSDANGPFAPLALDLRNEARGDLEVAARQGLAVVRFDCEHFEVLSSCHPKGDYGFIGFTKKEEVLQIEDNADLHIVLPLGPARLGGGIDRGSTLEVALAMVGKRTTTAVTLNRGQLDGDCAGASHFVRAMTVGAFAMSTSAHGTVRTAAAIFGAALDAKATDARSVRTKDGTLEACSLASPNDAAAPTQCGGILRIELVPLGVSRAVASVVASARSCRYGLADSCTDECRAGDATSCTVLGHMEYNGANVPKDRAASRVLFDRACKDGFADGCASLANLHYLGEGGLPVDKAQAGALYSRACAEGSAVGCASVGNLNYLGEGGYPVDKAKALAAYQRACDGGSPDGCALVGNMHYLGAGGVPVDKTGSLAFYRRACEGGAAEGCASMGNLYYLGEGGLAVDKARALQLYRRACEGGSVAGCNSAKRMMAQ